MEECRRLVARVPRLVWLRDELEAALRALPAENDDAGLNEWDTRRVTKMLLRYVPHEFRDRHGRTRRYVRRRGFKRVPLPGLPGSPEFVEAYSKAIDPNTAPRLEIGGDRTKPGTIADLVARYYRSPEFVGLKESTRSTYRSIIEPFREADMAPSASPFEARARRQGHAREEGRDADRGEQLAEAHAAVDGVRDRHWYAHRRPDHQCQAAPHHVARPSHIVGRATSAAFRRRHPSGTRARLAMEMALCTLQRRSDLVRMGRQHLQGGLFGHPAGEDRDRCRDPGVARAAA